MLKQKPNPNAVSENSDPYKKENIQFFQSLEEAAEYEARRNALIPGIQHLQNVTAFIMKRYKKELEQPNEKILYFKNDGHIDSGI